MSEHAAPPPKEHRWQAWISMVLAAGSAAGLITLALVQANGKDTAEQKTQEKQEQLDTTGRTALTLAEQIKKACAQGGKTAKDLGAACGQANVVVAQPQVQRGERGLTGRQGPPGPQGADGARGPRGATGSPGPQGNPGATGPAGESGPQGAQGNPGATGADGKDGAKGEPGAAGPSGVDGKDGAPGPACPSGYGPASAMVLTADGPRDAIICVKEASDAEGD